MAGDEDVEIPNAEEVVNEEDKDKEEGEEDPPKPKDKAGNKIRDAWEQESAFQRSARRAEYAVVANSQEDKDKSIKHQSKSLHEPLQEVELTIEYLKDQPEPKEKKAKERLVKRIEGLRRSRKLMHERLYELCIAQKHGWKVVTTYQHDKLEGEAKEVQKAVEKTRKQEEEAEKKSGGPSSKRAREQREPKASHSRHQGPWSNSCLLYTSPSPRDS